MFYLGLDIGSLSCDAVLIDGAGDVVSWSVVPTGARNSAAIDRAQREALEAAGVGAEELNATVATGYGRDCVDGRLASVTEITCHARGIRRVLPSTDVLVDIGGQDSKATRIDQAGSVVQFAMNDRCAAGTGRFLEAMARALEVGVDELGSLDEGGAGRVNLSSVCTVFAESEVVSLIAERTEVPEIVNGLHRAIATRTRGLVKRVAQDLSGLNVSMSGGVARNSGVIRALSAALGCEIQRPQEPDTVGALGAALIARDRWLSRETARSHRRERERRPRTWRETRRE
jgi:predicted CoA-substrate-specific enzyme activase